jgi:ABC-type transporter Mla MlaB component
MATRARRTVSFTVWGPILRSDMAGLTERVCRLLEQSGAEIALCEVRTVAVPDAVTVEALARLQLAAQRHACRVWLVNASQELHDLVAFMGLTDVIPG